LGFLLDVSEPLNYELASGLPRAVGINAENAGFVPFGLRRSAQLSARRPSARPCGCGFGCPRGEPSVVASFAATVERPCPAGSIEMLPGAISLVPMLTVG
jgi:hypothetical protein